MPILGFFSRNKKSRNAPDGTSDTDHDSPVSHSPTTEYVTPDKSLPSSPNGKNIYHNTVYPSLATSPGASSRLRIPFTRKPSASPSVSSSVTTDKPTIPTRPSFTSNTSTSVEPEPPAPEVRTRTTRSHLRPPPSKSAIFAAYADPNSALSTRSLPAEPTHTKTFSDLPPIPPLPSAPHAKKSFFGWAKGKSKTAPELAKFSPPPSLPDLVPAQERDSFNLKAFRHLSPPSPEDPLPAPRPRPRIDSFASDSSQRISVAAFREAQARRSVAGSPVPSFRSPSPGPLGSGAHLPKSPDGSPRVSRHGSPPAPRAAPRQNSSPQIRQPPVPALPPAHARNKGEALRRSTAPTLSVASSSAVTASMGAETSSESSEEEEDSEDDVGGRIGRQRTITKGTADTKPRTNPSKAKSESGHGVGYWKQGERVHSSFELLSGPAPTLNGTKADAMPPRSQSSLGIYGTPRPRGSASTSALGHAAPAAATSAAGPGPGSRHTRETAAVRTYSLNQSSSSSSSSSSADSEDDAPLATLVGPKRPGSSVSHASARAKVGAPPASAAHPRKPLIDISTLTAPAKPSVAPPSGPGFTGGATLLSAGSRPGVQPPPVKFVSPPTSDASSLSDREDAPGKKASVFQQKMTASPVSASPVSPQDPRRAASPPPSRKSTASPPRKEGVSSINFSERLSKVVQENVGKGPGGDTGVNASRPPRGHHRRASSDQTIAWREPAESPPPGAKSAEPRRSPEGDKAAQIVPTPIRQRDPPSSFSVTSRPRQHPEPSPSQPRPRSTTLLSPPTPSAALGASGGASGGGSAHGHGGGAPPNPRQRSTTMVPHSAAAAAHTMPARPFAERRESPASSTGGSSSGRVPLTPRDGSDVGGAKSEWGSSRDSAWGSGVSGLQGRGHDKKPSVVSFEEAREVRGRERRPDTKESAGQGENRRNERRRTEAKAAIELGNVINGPGPNLDDEDDEDDEVPVNQALGARMAMMSPRMGMPLGFPAPPPGSAGWAPWPQQAPMQQPLLSPTQFMVPPPADPAFFAAHQQAMLIAKQAYQMAVAQQALAAAGEEWERGSSAGGFGGAMSMYGGAAPAPLPLGGMGMGAGWPAGAVLQAAYGGARSDYGGGARSEYGAGWASSRSVYGESFGPSGDRARARRGTGAVPPLPDRAGNGGGGGGGAREGKGRARTASVPNPPVSPQRAGFGKKVVPPSSWKSGAV